MIAIFELNPDIQSDLVRYGFFAAFVIPLGISVGAFDYASAIESGLLPPPGWLLRRED